MQRSLKHTLTLWTSYHMSFYFLKFKRIETIIVFFSPSWDSLIVALVM